MLFNSWAYLVFMLAAVSLHWLLPHRARIGLLGVLSLVFYGMWRWEFAFLMIFSAWIDFFASLRIERAADKRGRFFWLLVSLTVNFGLLIVFKYAYFIHDQVRWLAALGGSSIPPLDDLGVRIILPLAISFYTFQTVSYTIDVYRRVVKATHDFWYFLTFVTFWPQLVAGPILRVEEVIPELRRTRSFAWSDLNHGLYRILIGLFKKAVLADNIALLVDSAFALEASALSAWDVWVAACLFGFQIYFDFSGYSDIALGSARMLGIYFPENFRWPYLATSPKAFWQRWHISLSSWIRDYLYLPLTGQRFQTRSVDGMAVASEATQPKLFKPLMFTWLLMGLWHGAAWRFVVWGAYHALLIHAYRIGAPVWGFLRRLPLLAWGLMFALVTAGWIPFRAQSMSQTLIMFQKIGNPWAYRFQTSILDREWYACVFLLLAGMGLIRGAKWLYDRSALCQKAAPCVHTAALAAITFFILIYLRPMRPFIYFQF